MASAVFALETALVLLLCLFVLQPFLKVLLWAIALAVVGKPFYRRVVARVPSPTFAAGASVLMLGCTIVAPLIYLGSELYVQASSALEWGRRIIEEERWRVLIEGSPGLARLVDWISSNFNLRAGLTQTMQLGGSYIPAVFSSSIWTIIGLALVLFTTFFLLRDSTQLLQGTRRYLPLSPREENRFFEGLADTIYATVYGLFLVAAIQGLLGGLFFWLFGLPNVVLWGALMAMFAVIPNLGPVVVWAPVAVYLIATGDLLRGIGILLTGALIVGTIDNVLYPMLVGSRLRFHTLLVLFFLLGGVSTFGIVGIVAGPLLLSVAHSAHAIWLERYEDISEASDGLLRQ